MKILVFGNGWLGNRVADYFHGVVSDANILDVNGVEEAIEVERPHVVVNCAAKCGSPNIDWCAKPENRRITQAVNGYGPRVLESVCGRRSVKMVHVSSGCIWESGANITETCKPEPPSWYSVTKVLGERLLKEPSTLVLRPRMPVDWCPHPRNLIDKLARYNRVLTEQNSVTVVTDLMRAMKALLEMDCSGVYHVANPGSVSGAWLMERYMEIVDSEHCFQMVDMEYLRENKLITDGRSNVVLNTDKLASVGVELPDARDRVVDCLKEYAACRSSTYPEAG